MTDNKALVMASANGMIDKSKELQKEILMEKLRSKTPQFKNLSETSKAVRMAMLVSTQFAVFLYRFPLLRDFITEDFSSKVNV